MIPADVLKKISAKVIEYSKENTPKQVTMPAYHDGSVFGYLLAINEPAPNTPEQEGEEGYWKKRCEAAEMVLSSMECGITTLPTDETKIAHEQAYNYWISLKNKQ